MRRDSRLSVALHVLLHLGEEGDPMTSEQLGLRMGLNPVVLRRTLGLLRDAAIVNAEKGHGGGWTVGRDLAKVTLGDVYDALGPTTLFAIGYRDARPKCPIEQAVNRTMAGALDEAEALLMKRLQGVSVADVLGPAQKQKRAQARARMGRTA